MTLNNIDRKTNEGRLLFAALVILTQSPSLIIGGEDVNGTNVSPDKMLEHLETLAKKIDE